MQQELSELRLKQNKLVIFILVTTLSLIALLSYFFVDKPVLGWLYEHPQKWHKNIFVNGLEQFGKAWVIIWLLLLWAYVFRRLQLSINVLLTLLLVALAVCPLKVLIHRPRPNESVEIAHQLQANVNNNWFERDMQSFPSGDAASAFAATVALAPFISLSWLIVLLAVSTAVGLLRIVGMAHYPSDVLAGTAIGILCASVVLEIISKCQNCRDFKAEQYRSIVAAALILIPVIAAVFIGMDQFLIFMVTSCPLAAGFYIASKFRRNDSL